MQKRILLVDDEENFTELTKTLLSFHDFEVDAYNDPIDIEKIVAQKQYAIIVTDIMMPNMDGFEMIKKLRAKKEYQKTPIIVLSAKTLTDSERKILLQQKAHFLAKPFDPQGLVEKIQQLLA